MPGSRRPPVDVRRRHAKDVEEERLEDLVEEVHPADADRAERVAVVRLAQRDELRLLRLAPQLPVLEGDLQRHFDRGGARVRIEDLVQDRLSLELGSPPDELRGELDGRRRGEAEERRVRDVFELELHRGVDLRLAVPVDVHPQRRDGVEVLAPPGVEEPRAARVGDDDGLVARERLEPGLHLRERTPDVGAVERGEPLVSLLLCSVRDLVAHAAAGSARSRAPSRAYRSRSAARRRSTCSSSCAAESAMRRRLVPSGTVGGRIGRTYSPFSRSIAAARSAASGAPTTTGKIGVSSEAGKPSLRNAAATRAMERRNFARRASPSSPDSSASATSAASAIAGGRAVLKTSDRARLTRRSRQGREHTT